MTALGQTARRKFILLTGASSGIGHGVALRLSQTHNLILHGRNKLRLEEIRVLCANPDNHLLWISDFSDASLVAENLESFLVENGAQVITFIHSAGQPFIHAARNADFQKALECLSVNYLSAQQIITVLSKKRVNHGSLANVILVSSIWSTFGAAGYSLYCASKAALEAMVRALAIELAPGTRINSIAPGGVDTPMAAAALADSEIANNIKNTYPLGLGTPDDVANVVEFLLTPSASWITGQRIVADGGRSVNMSLK
jgi:NAD(P)-dependent dehydrogenase (short-subunit alcohol dehydrogenase family)